MNKSIELKLLQEIKKADSKGLAKKTAYTIANAKRDLVKKVIINLERNNKIYYRQGSYYDGKFLQSGTIVDIKKNFGFATLNNDDGTRVFIPGHMLLGSLIGDTVLLAPIESRNANALSQEGEVIRITKEGKSEFIGTVIQTKKGYFIESEIIKADIAINHLPIDVEVNDLVLCKIVNREFAKNSNNTNKLKVKIIKSYKGIDNAYSACEIILDTNDISRVFPEEVIECADKIEKKGITNEEISGRTDLRNKLIFTIDGANTKDIDDAVSVEKMGEYYALSVHIADVSHYVKQYSPINAEAYTRGTSIYFANQVIPMLPQSLSNGICSLNPNVDRLAFTCNMVIDTKGELIDFSFEKTVINSKMKGVYHEVNQIFDGTANDELKEKYKFAVGNLNLMKELANILTQNKIKRGVADIHTNECSVVLDENYNPIDIVPRSSGQAELMIEEFMLMANQATATAGRVLNIPMIYRVHEPPTAEKIENLHNILKNLNIPTKSIEKEIKTTNLAKLINDAKDEPYYPIINTAVLRSMSKAKYFEEPIGHFGLVLENYAQFTSPIRRYPDLVIHRVLSEYVAKVHPEKLRQKYTKTIKKSATNSTKTEVMAMKIERQCDDCYKAQYMKQFLGDDFEGVICSVVDYGFYVELPNTVDGLVRIQDLPEAGYIFDGVFGFKNETTKQEYKIGDKIKVKCVKVDIAKGNVDFIPS